MPASNSATIAVQGQQAYTTAGSYSWVAPSGVTSVSAVAIGGGGGGGSGGGAGGGGGGLGYKNNYSVTPQVLTLWWWVRAGATGSGSGAGRVLARHPISLILLQYAVAVAAAGGRVMAELLVRRGNRW